MPSPSASLSTQRPDLAASFEEFSLEADRMGYIGMQVMPVAEVAKQSGNFGIIPIEQLLDSRDTKRAPGGDYSRGDWKFETSTYACEEHGAEEPVDDREAAMYREYFDAELVAAQRARHRVLEALERRIADAIFNATTWTPTSVTNEWDDASNATPIDDVEARVQAVYDASGVWPDTLVISRKVFRNLRNVSQIIDRLKYQGFQDVRPERITMASLGLVFDLPKIYVGGGTKNTADEGQSASLSPIWSGEYAWIGKTANSQDFKEVCVGRTFHWSEDGSDIGTAVETYREEKVRSDIVRARMDTDELVIYSAVGALLDNITT